ncbi:MAG: hypothetical protein EXQ70_00890 [Solirubrobacterales bacterium]|nr:hypothetical protein [Solirubrobacterales bacterium]
MRFESLQLVPYALDFREPYVSARGELSRRELMLVRLRADGIEGLGEAAPLALRGGPGLEQIARELEDLCRPALEEAEIDPERLWSTLTLCRNRGASLQALSAIDIALHDLAGKALGAPVWRLLGAQEPGSVRCNATLPAANPTHLRRLTEAWRADGFDTFKLKVGLPGDVRQVELVREICGPDALIRVDANEVWTLEQAVERLRAMALHTIELAEQPVSGLQAMAALRDRTRVSLAADESLVTPRDARRASELKACDAGTVKLAKSGGMLAALELSESLPIYLSSALDGPVGIAAAAHTALALPAGGDAGVAHGLATGRLFKGTIASRQPALAGPEIELTDEPGLGVFIDEGALASRSA